MKQGHNINVDSITREVRVKQRRDFNGESVTMRMEGSKRKRIVNAVFNEGAKNKASLSCIDAELRKYKTKLEDDDPRKSV